MEKGYVGTVSTACPLDLIKVDDACLRWLEILVARQNVEDLE